MCTFHLYFNLEQQQRSTFEPAYGSTSITSPLQHATSCPCPRKTSVVSGLCCGRCFKPNCPDLCELFSYTKGQLLILVHYYTQTCLQVHIYHRCSRSQLPSTEYNTHRYQVAELLPKSDIRELLYPFSANDKALIKESTDDVNCK